MRTTAIEALLKAVQRPDEGAGMRVQGLTRDDTVDCGH